MIRISQKDADEVLSVLGCYAVSTGKRLLTFRRIVLSPSSGFKSLLGLPDPEYGNICAPPKFR